MKIEITSVRFPEDVYEQLRLLSFTTRESINQIVVKAVVKYMEDVKK
jgi:predicted DNA-binding protein